MFLGLSISLALGFRLMPHAPRLPLHASRLRPHVSRILLPSSHSPFALACRSRQHTPRLFQSHSLHSYFTLSHNFSHNFKCILVSMQIFNFLAVFHLSNILHRKKSIEKKKNQVFRQFFEVSRI